MKIYFHDAGNMTKNMVKTLQKSFSLEPVHVFLRNLVCSIGVSADHSLFKLLPWGDLDLFNDKVKFCNLGCSIGKKENSGFFRN